MRVNIIKSTTKKNTISDTANDAFKDTPHTSKRLKTNILIPARRTGVRMMKYRTLLDRQLIR